jgi:hypothetical protein
MTDDMRNLMIVAKRNGLCCWLHDDRDSVVVLRTYGGGLKSEHRVYNLRQLYNLLGN